MFGYVLLGVPGCVLLCVLLCAFVCLCVLVCACVCWHCRLALRKHCRIAEKTMRNHCTSSVQSLRNRCGCGITAETMRNHCAITAQSLRNLNAITAQSLQNRCKIIAKSLHKLCAITAESLWKHWNHWNQFGIVARSLLICWEIATQSLRNWNKCGIAKSIRNRSAIYLCDHCGIAAKRRWLSSTTCLWPRQLLRVRKHFGSFCACLTNSGELV
jgi:hypothetical protein